MRTRLALAAFPAGLAALVALAGCGSGSNSATASQSTSATSGGGMATIDMTKNPQLGPILTDSNGNTAMCSPRTPRGCPTAMARAPLCGRR